MLTQQSATFDEELNLPKTFSTSTLLSWLDFSFECVLGVCRIFRKTTSPIVLLVTPRTSLFQEENIMPLLLYKQIYCFQLVMPIRVIILAYCFNSCPDGSGRLYNFHRRRIFPRTGVPAPVLLHTRQPREHVKESNLQAAYSSVLVKEHTLGKITEQI